MIRNYIKVGFLDILPTVPLRKIMICILTFLFAFANNDAFAKTLTTSHPNVTKRIFLEGTDEKVSFIVIGDWGSGHHHQDEVATAMGRWCLLHDCDFIVSTGDNIYSNGVSSPTDDEFDETWRKVYTHPSIRFLPWYLTVGNHDHVHSNGEWYQVEYSLINPRWNMPSLAYAFDMVAGNTTVKFVSIDTVSIEDDKNCATCMIMLLRSELASADSSAWKIVYGHYPMHSGGHYGGSDSLRSSVEPILEQNKVDFYLSGHDHNQQHWAARSGAREHVEHVTTGAGGESQYDQWSTNVHENEDMGWQMKHFDKHYGFAYFTISEDEMLLQFVNTYDMVIYHSVRQK